MPEPRENARAALEAVVASELAAEVPDDARVLTDEIRRRHGDALAAVLYYGSCRRKKTTDGGVLDFYAVVLAFGSSYVRRCYVHDASGYGAERGALGRAGGGRSGARFNSGGGFGFRGCLARC